jgi:PIN like domain
VRVLLDECLPRRLKHDLAGHDVRTAPEMGWASKANGELLGLAAGEFDVFLTVDRNLSYQQDVSALDIAVLVMVAHSNALDVLRPLVPLVLDALANPKRGAVTLIRAEGESQTSRQR